MTQMTEQEVLSRMGVKGMANGIEAVAELLVSMGYHDAAKELRLRWDEHYEWMGEDA